GWRRSRWTQVRRQPVLSESRFERDSNRKAPRANGAPFCLSRGRCESILQKGENMNVLKFLLGVVFFVALVILLQLPEAPVDSPSLQFQRLPDVAAPPAEAGNSFENLAGSTVADAALYGNLPPQADPEFAAALDRT